MSPHLKAFFSSLKLRSFHLSTLLFLHPSTCHQQALRAHPPPVYTCMMHVYIYIHQLPLGRTRKLHLENSPTLLVLTLSHASVWCRKCHYSATARRDLRRHYREWHAQDLTTNEDHFAESTYQQSHHVTIRRYLRNLPAHSQPVAQTACPVRVFLFNDTPSHGRHGYNTLNESQNPAQAPWSRTCSATYFAERRIKQRL